MPEREAIMRRVSRIIDRLSKPLTQADLDGGWTLQSQAAMLGFFQRLNEEIRSDASDLNKYGSITRGMDHWGIVEGDLLDEAATISRQIAEASDE